MDGSAVARPQAAEFFAGMGLVRMALTRAGYEVVFAHDISETKRRIYEANFGSDDFVRGDIKDLLGSQVPEVNLATASFPCTDLSLAGNRAGLDGAHSSMFREFNRILFEMGEHKPKTVLLENVVGLASSQDGADLAEAIASLNGLGYACDIVTVDARWFVAQSRPRVFVIATQTPITDFTSWYPSRLRPTWICRFREQHPELHMQAAHLPEPPQQNAHLAHYVEQLHPEHETWWNGAKLEGFLGSLSFIQMERLEAMRRSDLTIFATAYRRTRYGKPVWEIRADDISGCLRTGRGGSSRQALVEAGFGDVRVRWMTAREYARLQGVPNVSFGGVTEAQARFALGDAVCVPAVAWLMENYLQVLKRQGIADESMVTAYA